MARSHLHFQSHLDQAHDHAINVNLVYGNRFLNVRWFNIAGCAHFNLNKRNVRILYSCECVPEPGLSVTVRATTTAAVTFRVSIRVRLISI